MNERIRELAEQAGITTNLDTDYFEKDINKWVDYYSEKFAELIAQDCIDIVATYSVRIRQGEEYLHPVQEIRQHFGIER